MSHWNSKCTNTIGHESRQWPLKPRHYQTVHRTALPSPRRQERPYESWGVGYNVCTLPFEMNYYEAVLCYCKCWQYRGMIITGNPIAAEIGLFSSRSIRRGSDACKWHELLFMRGDQLFHGDVGHSYASLLILTSFSAFKVTQLCPGTIPSSLLSTFL